MEQLKNRYNLDKEKLEWLKEIGAKEYKEPMVYSAGYGKYLLSERYLKETPLSTLKKQYKKAVRMVKQKG